MADKKIKPEVKLTPEDRQKLCLSEVQASLTKHNCSILSVPSFKARDDGTFSVVSNVHITVNK